MDEFNSLIDIFNKNEIDLNQNVEKFRNIAESKDKEYFIENF